MTGFGLRVLRRDRLFLITALLGITLLAWAYTIYLASQMSMPSTRLWQPADLGFNFLMWAVMMVAMMTPTAAPMVLTFAYVALQRNASQPPTTIQSCLFRAT